MMVLAAGACTPVPPRFTGCLSVLCGAAAAECAEQGGTAPADRSADAEKALLLKRPLLNGRDSKTLWLGPPKTYCSPAQIHTSHGKCFPHQLVNGKTKQKHLVKRH